MRKKKGQRNDLPFALSNPEAARNSIQPQPSKGSLLETVFFAELLHASRGIHQLLLTGIERMAVGAYFDVDIARGGARLYGIAAGTGNNRLLVFGMDGFLHGRKFISQPLARFNEGVLRALMMRQNEDQWSG
jgi:hypothetical protein